MNEKTKENIIIAAFFTLYILYALMFIFNTSFKFKDTRYYSLFDDAMISMRYAKNLAQGHGAVWNPGEKVEGYSNPLWMAYMAVPHLLKMHVSKTSYFIQLSGLILNIMTLILVYRITMFITGRFIAGAGAVFLCASFFPFNYWSLFGMETGLLGFLITLSLYIITTGKKPLPAIPILISLMILTRMDMLLTAIGISGAVLFTKTKNKNKIFIYSLGSAITTILLLSIVRYAYYSEWLPNTYYLKLVGYPVFWRIMKGLYSTSLYLFKSWLIPVIIPFVFLALKRDLKYILLFVPFCIQALYNIYIGGDAWDNSIAMNRFLIPSIPLFIAALSISVFNILKNNYTKLFIPAVLILSVMFNLSCLAETILLKPGVHTKDIGQNIQSAYIINAGTEHDALIGVVRAGTLPYFIDRKCTDFLGKNDKRIARLPMAKPVPGMKFMDKVKFFYPGHLKSDLEYSVLHKKPDIIYGVWGAPENIKKYIHDEYLHVQGDIFLRKDSRKVKWKNISIKKGQ